MAALSNQEVKRAGLKPAYASANGGGDTFEPGENVYLHAKNGSEASITVTIVTPGKVIGADIADVAVAIPGGEERMIGPFPSRHFADPTTGKASITYSGVTSLTIAALELAQP
jgi:hypothetical protein